MNDKELIRMLITAYLKPGGDLKRMLNLLNRANPDEITILASIMHDRPAQSFFGDVMSGAHVELVDGHSRYHAWRALKTAKPRPTLHQTEGKAYQLVGPLCHAILFGKRRDVTWVQLENHPWGGGIKNRIMHTIDWRNYHATEKNQGPYGSSIYVESYPLRFQSPTQPKVVAVPRMIIR